MADRTDRLIEANRLLKSEIHERQRSEAHSRYLAYHDAVTGLGNRLLFKEQVDQALGEASASMQAIAVLFVDLDGFKAVNETSGHSAGDRLLKSVAIRLRDLVSTTDRIARLGGDEFAILQTSVVQPNASRLLADRIVASLSAPSDIGTQDLTFGASVGIALDRGDGDSETLLKNAEMAMYGAKAGGRGTYRMFDPEMDSTARVRRDLERTMRDGVSRNAFRLVYQPLANLASGKVTAFEALIRFEHPARGFVSPSKFVPVAEETGLIVRLGEWVLRQACAEAATWPSGVGVSVNLSPVQFSQGDLTSIVMNALAATRLPASRLELEITESVLLDGSDHNLDTLNRLRALGVRISIDDFGTGYSSIGYLRKFKFDRIKIDRSFVQDLIDDEGSLAIVLAVIGLGASFGIATTAEGVETKAQADRLLLEGCDEAQGYLFSRPVPPDCIDGVLASVSGLASNGRAARSPLPV